MSYFQLNRSSKLNPSISSRSSVRQKLRHLVDDPRGESSEFQEKIANALKLAEDFLAYEANSELPVRTETAFFQNLLGPSREVNQ